jgi:hypothetical protein
MATIKKRACTVQTDLFSLSVVAMSDSLYKCIFMEIKKRYGKSLRKISREMIEEKISKIPDLKGVVITSEKRNLSISVAVDSITFSPGNNEGIVDVNLLLPIYGEAAKVKKLAEEVAMEIGLSEISNAGNGLEIKIVLRDENLPFQISPNPHFAVNGRGQKCFVLKKDLLACSPIR